ncbi:MAG: hypothetical protein H6741_05655 [Alphaproteobacteria bacterium]|nr:hypothetical protein [Alphaproteobacteria bacterium]
MESLLALAAFVLAAVALRWGVSRLSELIPARREGAGAPPPRPATPAPRPRARSGPAPKASPPLSPMIFLVLEGPEKALFVRLDPFAALGGPTGEGNWVQVDGEIFVRVEGLDSQLGVVLLDLWALLGEDEAKATLARPARVVSEWELQALGQKLGGLQAMEGWMQVPSLACYKPPAPEDFPALLPVKLQFPSTSVQLFMDRGRLLEVAGRRTHPTAAPRGIRPGAKGPALDPERAQEAIVMAAARYQSSPAVAVALLEEAFGPGSIVESLEPSLKMGLAQVWGLSLRNAGRIEEALARFTWGLEQAPDDGARQQLSYNRGYARLMGLMDHREAGAGRLVQGRLAMDPAHVPELRACSEDFRRAAALGPEDVDAHSQVALCAQCLAELVPEEREARLGEARESLHAALALESAPEVRAALEARLGSLG